ncbi:MAG TPA: hypothetical protein VD710_07110 [Nitrososphaeraceae archaeon]|nr:hypothetical protein [Nitrososphaeraceae archaeon]
MSTFLSIPIKLFWSFNSISLYESTFRLDIIWQTENPRYLLVLKRPTKYAPIPSFTAVSNMIIEANVPSTIL